MFTFSSVVCLQPKQPPRAPKAAPFFLPTIAGLEFKFDVPDDEEKQVSASLSPHHNTKGKADGPISILNHFDFVCL